MKLVTWNCCRGTFTDKIPFVQALAPDVAVVQECAHPPTTSERCMWFGDNPRQGLCVLAGPEYHLERVPPIAGLPRYVLPVRVHGPTPFLLFAIWTLREPTYVEPVFQALEAYEGLLRSEPSVWMGDFNSNAIWDRKRRPARDHNGLVDAFAVRGLVSAYHHASGEAHGGETRATYYHRWKEDQPFHIDYCFLPREWAERIESVEVGSYHAWKERSDHRPMVVRLTS